MNEALRRRAAIMVAIALTISGVGALTAIPSSATTLIRYRDPVFSTVNVQRNIPFARVTNLSKHRITLRYDLYTPAGDTVTHRPAIVWVHGGSFCCGTKDDGVMVDEANEFAKRGFVGISIEYRLESPGCTGNLSNCAAAVRESAADAQAAVWVLRHRAASYGVDPNRIAMGGDSAGAITALNVGYSSGGNAATGIRAAVSISGAHLLVGTMGRGDAPALLFHGSADTTVLYSAAQATVHAAHQAGLHAALVTWKGEGHVPYFQHKAQVLAYTAYFFWVEMDLGHAPH